MEEKLSLCSVLCHGVLVPLVYVTTYRYPPDMWDLSDKMAKCVSSLLTILGIGFHIEGLFVRNGILKMHHGSNWIVNLSFFL